MKKPFIISTFIMFFVLLALIFGSYFLFPDLYYTSMYSSKSKLVSVDPSLVPAIVFLVLIFAWWLLRGRKGDASHYISLIGVVLLQSSLCYTYFLGISCPSIANGCDNTGSFMFYVGFTLIIIFIYLVLMVVRYIVDAVRRRKESSI